MPSSQVLHPAAGCLQLHFGTLDSVEDAIDLFDADPVIAIAMLHKAHLLFSHSGYELRLPNRANKRVLRLLEQYGIPFTTSVALC